MTKEKPIYIDENVNIIEGESASSMIRKKIGQEDIDLQKGLIRVDLDRWQEAQRYERKTWLEIARKIDTDRNEYHCERFSSYAPLRGLQFERGIELGCGPFTNMRFILEQCTIREVFLLDPLISDYLNHRHCRYYGGRVGGLIRHRLWMEELLHPFRLVNNLVNSYRIGKIKGKPVNLIESMIETYQTSSIFDLVVLINVLEHCRDAELVFDKILDLIVPGGKLVFHDRLYSEADVKRLSSNLYDSGHPLRINRSVIENFLHAHFKPLMRAEFFGQYRINDLLIDQHELYFIGDRIPLNIS